MTRGLNRAISAIVFATLLAACSTGGHLSSSGSAVFPQGAAHATSGGTSANSTAPSIAWSPATSGAFDFGTVFSGSSSQTFTLTNTGSTATSALKVTLTLASGSSGFTITADACSATSLGPKKTCTVSVSYAFTANGESDSATLTATSKKPAARATLALTGKSMSPNQTFSYTGGSQTFTVPSGVTQITVDAVGAGGGKGCDAEFYSGAGGLGFELKASGIAVTPGQILYVYVGGSPVANTGSPCSGVPLLASFASAGFNGGGTGAVSSQIASSGGGGGASDVRTSSSDLTSRVLVAGGGGGAASFGGVSGGNGGYPDGAAGGYLFVNGADPGSLFAGQGGTQAAGGPGGQTPSFQGIFLPCNGIQGSLGIGGDSGCAATEVGGGAGGAGYYGGGSGAVYTSNNSTGDQGVSAGGGGSSFAVSGATVVTQQVATSGQCDANNNGCITISW